MPIALVLALLVSLNSFAGTKQCHRELSQADKNECMAFERDKAVGTLMTRVTEYCSHDSEIQEAKGGSIYPMLLDECMTRELLGLVKKVD